MFSGFLDWIRPTDNDHKLCWKLSKAIKRIVDSVLDAPSPMVQRQQHQQQQALSQTDLDFLGSYGTRDDDVQDASITTGIEDLDDLSWLSTIDWTQGNWLDMNHQATL